MLTKLPDRKVGEFFIALFFISLFFSHGSVFVYLRRVLRILCRMATIILTGGGTAGHVTPHLALMPYLKKDFDKIYYFGSENGIEKTIITKTGVPYFSVPCAKLQRKFTLKNLAIPFKVFNGIRAAGKIIDKIKPDVVFSKGGFVAVPTVVAAKRRGVPVISHESDYTVGLANSVTAGLCKKVLTSFPETAEKLKNGEYVGAPLRDDLFKVTKEKALARFHISGEKPVLLVTGGSSGAQAINDVVRKSLGKLLPTFDVIHICGKGNLSKEDFGNGYRQIEYISDIKYAFRAADVCVSRAGSNTLFEILSLAIPCLLIPLPKGVSRGDQVLNAEYFEKRGLVSVLPQEKLDEKSFIRAVNGVYLKRDKLRKNLELHPVTNASPKIAEILRAQINRPEK